MEDYFEMKERAVAKLEEKLQEQEHLHQRAEQKAAEAWFERNRPDMAAKTIGEREVSERKRVISLCQNAERTTWEAEAATSQYSKEFNGGQELVYSHFMGQLVKRPEPATLTVAGPRKQKTFKLGKWVTITIAVSK